MNNRLRMARKRKGLTQAQVGEAIGVSQNTYSYWENGKVKIDNESLTKLAKLFDESIDFLLSNDNFTESDNPLDEQLKDIAFALYGEMSELSDDAKRDIIDFYNFKKAQEKKKGK